VQRRSWRTPEKIFRLDLSLDSQDAERLRPGMRLRGEIEVGRIPDVVLVPLEAVFPGPDGPVVHRRTPLGFETVAVDLGERDAERVVVLDGVRAGDRLAARNLREETS
jgi:multidrug efflux pump subunit AcrA (membrane-fusion protein)